MAKFDPYRFARNGKLDKEVPRTEAHLGHESPVDPPVKKPRKRLSAENLAANALKKRHPPSGRSPRIAGSRKMALAEFNEMSAYAEKKRARERAAAEARAEPSTRLETRPKTRPAAA